MIFFSIKFLQVFDKQKGAGAAICNPGSGTVKQFNFGSSATAPEHCFLRSFGNLHGSSGS
jgi:hypothetical protein